MDISALFRASVKTVNLRNEELGIVGVKSAPKRNKIKSSFYAKTQTVVVQIAKLREFLLENQRAYSNLSNYLSVGPRMTDAERDEIDTGAQKIMGTCLQLVKDLKREVVAIEVSRQNIEHREITLLLIENYLKNVCKIYSEQKATRVKRVMEMRRIVKLQSEPRSDVRVTKVVEKPIPYTAKKVTEERESRNNSNESSPMKIQEINGDVNALIYEEEPSSEDIQMFRLENEQLYNELNTVTEEVKRIESKVVHIAELQEIFTEKVLDQDRDLDRLMTTVVGSTENVKEANEQIRQAIQRNAGLRVWILFFLLVMSFSLLFLDWYNP